MGCLASLGKVFLGVVNGIFLLLGLGLLVVGCLIKFNVTQLTDEILPLLNQIAVGDYTMGTLVSAISIVVICVGAVVAVFAGIGFFGVFCKSTCLLYTYAILMFIVVAAQIAVVVMWFLVKDKLNETLKTQLVTVLATYEGNTGNSLTMAWNLLFMNVKCCGVNAYSTSNDFTGTAWYTAGTSGDVIPAYCCSAATADTVASLVGTSCASAPTSNNAYIATGCYDGIINVLTSYGNTTIIIGCIILAVEIMAIVFACLFAKDVKKKKRTGSA